MLRLLAATGGHWALGNYVESSCKGSADLEPVFETLKRDLTRGQFLAILTQFVASFAKGNTPLAAGQALLDASDADLQEAAKATRTVEHQCNECSLRLAQFLHRYAPERLRAVAEELLRPQVKEIGYAEQVYPLAQYLMSQGLAYESVVKAALENLTDAHDRTQLVRTLYNCRPEAYRDLLLAEGRNYFKHLGACSDELGQWLVQTFGLEIRPDIIEFMSFREWAGLRRGAMQAAVKHWGKEALPVVLAALEQPHDDLRREAMIYLTQLDEGSQGERIAKVLRQGLAEKSERDLKKWVEAARLCDPRPVERELQAILAGKFKSLRRAAAQALAKMGEERVESLRADLADKKADVRSNAVLILEAMANPAALGLLEDRLDKEGNEEVRDQILNVLARSWQTSGRSFNLAQVQAWADRSKPGFPAWLRLEKLPAIGGLSQPLRDHLIYRQSRALGVTPDPEARAVMALSDPTQGADFAFQLLQQFAAAGTPAKDRFPLSLVANYGDDRALQLLIEQIPVWADSKRLKMAEDGILALALNGSQRALEAIDIFARKWASKNPSLGRAALEAYEDAARREGVTPAELGDRIVPWLGFEPGQKRRSVEGVELNLASDLKLDKLPKTAGAAAKQAYKELSARLKEAAQTQTRRLETLMVEQHRWPQASWRELFLRHPLLMPFAQRLVWTDGNQTFRVLEDLSLTNHEEDSVALDPGASVGLVHPLDLSEEERQAWLEHLANHRVVPPFGQMDRPIARLDHSLADERRWRHLRGTEMNGLTFRSRAEKRGWRRGASESGCVMSYFKAFPKVAVEAHVEVDGLYFGIGRDESIHLGDVWPLKAGTAHWGVPSDDSDPATLPLGELPALVYSEVMGDLSLITGSQPTDDAA